MRFGDRRPRCAVARGRSGRVTPRPGGRARQFGPRLVHCLLGHARANAQRRAVIVIIGALHDHRRFQASGRRGRPRIARHNPRGRRPADQETGDQRSAAGACQGREGRLAHRRSAVQDRRPGRDRLRAAEKWPAPDRLRRSRLSVHGPAGLARGQESVGAVHRQVRAQARCGQGRRSAEEHRASGPARPGRCAGDLCLRRPQLHLLSSFLSAGRTAGQGGQAAASMGAWSAS